MHSLKKDCKIISEITLYLMLQGHNDINLEISNSQEQITIKFTTYRCNDELIEKIKQEVNVERELEVEEYGWELMGESDAQSGLNLVGRLVDFVTVDNQENKTIFTFVRRHLA